MCNIKKCYQERSLTWVNKAGKSKIVDYTILLITYNTFILSNSGISKIRSYVNKATIFCDISILDLSYVVTVKYTVEILQKFVAFSGYMNFM